MSSFDCLQMCEQIHDDSNTVYISEKGKTCPMEILEILAKYNAEGRPIWKPMHMQPMYRMYELVTVDGIYAENFCVGDNCVNVGTDIFERGLCLPGDNKMTLEEQLKVNDIIRSVFY